MHKSRTEHMCLHMHDSARCVTFEAEAQEFIIDDGKGGGGAENEGFTIMPEQPITVSLSYLFFCLGEN